MDDNNSEYVDEDFVGKEKELNSRNFFSVTVEVIKEYFSKERGPELIRRRD